MKGFISHSVDDGQAMPFETLPATAGLAVNVGTALTVTAGKLALAAGTTKPSYICMTARAATTDGERLPVQRVADKVIYQTELSEAAAGLAMGGKHTIAADGGGITATTASGVAEVVSFEGTAAGDTVRVRFG